MELRLRERHAHHYSLHSRTPRSSENHIEVGLVRLLAVVHPFVHAIAQIGSDICKVAHLAPQHGGSIAVILTHVKEYNPRIFLEKRRLSLLAAV